MPHDRSRISNLVAGLLTVLVGGFAVWEASGYPFGQLARIGPGFFPVAIGILIIVLGVGILFEREPRLDAHTSDGGKFGLRAFFFVPASVLVFIVLAGRFGVMPAVSALVLISALADPEYPVKQAVALSVILAIMASLIFVLGFGLPLPVARI